MLLNPADTLAPAASAAGPRLSIWEVRPFNAPGACLNAPSSIDAPRRPIAARTLSIAPVKVLPDDLAAPPTPCSMAFWNMAKLICPLELIA